MLDRIETIEREGSIAENIMVGTAIRLLPRSVGWRLCEMGSRKIVVTWRVLFQYVRTAEQYLEEPHVPEICEVRRFDYRDSNNSEESRRRTRYCKICKVDSHWTDI